MRFFPALVLCVGLTLSSVSFAGKDRGGGMGFECKNSAGKVRVFLADTYEVFKDIPVETVGDVIPQVVHLLNIIRPEKIYRSPFFSDELVSMGWLVSYFAEIIEMKPLPKDRWHGQRLREVGDDEFPEDQIPQGCRKVQLAVQYMPFHNVYYDSHLVEKMSALEFEYLRLHEILSAARLKPGASTREIREVVLYVAKILHH